jgi:hypothetical protein
MVHPLGREIPWLWGDDGDDIVVTHEAETLDMPSSKIFVLSLSTAHRRPE